jgi:DNA-binding transcriptional regulator YiaG
MTKREFTDITDDVDEVLTDPELSSLVANERAAMREADRRYAMSLAALRRAFDLTQVELAERLGVTQANVAKIEQRHDLLVSTLRSYLDAIGGEIRIVVTFSDREPVEIELGALEATERP